MKIKAIYIVSGCILFIGSILFTSFRSAPGVVQPYRETPSFSVPEFPSHISFAGEDVDLERFDMYERYDRELTSLCYGHTNTLLILKRANRYFPIIEPILKKQGIPEDFLYLVAVESLLNIRALSPVKAAGLWQLMSKTGQQYGLEVNDYVDERYNIEVATIAACKYLKDAYNKYGSWLTVAASYNAGMGRISSELSKQMVDHTFDLWLNEETSRYVFRILGIKEILSRPAEYGFTLRKKQLYQPIRTRKLEIDTAITDLAQFAKEQGITYSQLKEFNLWLRGRELPNKTGKKYIIQIPIEQDMYYNGRREYVVYRKNWITEQ